MKELLKKMGWIDYRNRVDKAEIVIDMIILISTILLIVTAININEALK